MFDILMDGSVQCNMKPQKLDFAQSNSIKNF